MNDSNCRLFRSRAEYVPLPFASQKSNKEGVLYKKLCVIVLSALASLVFFASSSAADLTPHTPLGPVIFLDGTSRAEPYGDNQATAIYFGADRPAGYPAFMLGWLGSIGSGISDIPVPTSNETTGSDRVLISRSADGHFFDSIDVAIKGRGGDTGITGPASLNVHDDYTCGSPSFIHAAEKLAMFYECIGNSMHPLYSLWSAPHSDTHAGFLNASGRLLADDDSSYFASTNPSTLLGFALQSPRRDTRPIYAGEAVYPGIGINRFLSRNPVDSTVPGGASKPLNGGSPAFYVFKNPGAGRTILFTCFDGAQSNTFATTDSECWGRGSIAQVEQLGYIATANSSDLDGVAMNSIFLATWTDQDESWVRFEGPYLDGAVIEPFNPRSNIDCPGRHPFTMTHENGVASYGAGFPIATIRDGKVEVHYADSTLNDEPTKACAPDTNGDEDPNGGTYIYSRRIELKSIFDRDAWLQPEIVRQAGGVGTDLAWDPITRRYYANRQGIGDGGNCSPNRDTSTEIVRSQRIEPGTFPILNFADEGSVIARAGSLPGWNPLNGGFARTPQGHVVRDPYHKVFHLYVASVPPFGTTYCNPNNLASVFDDFDIDHILIFDQDGYDIGPWLNRDGPGGSGDFEVGFSSVGCANQVHVQARIRNTITVINHPDEAPDNLRVFSASQGLACVNGDQPDQSCSNYEVRFFCAAQ